MMYRTRRELQFMLHGKSNDTTTIPEGTRLVAVQTNTLDDDTRTPLERMSKSHRERFPQERLVFFEWMGVIRSAVAGKDVVMTRRRRTRR